MIRHTNPEEVSGVHSMEEVGTGVGIAVGLIAIFKLVVPLFRTRKQVGLPEEQQDAPQTPWQILPEAAHILDTGQYRHHVPALRGENGPD